MLKVNIEKEKENNIFAMPKSIYCIHVQYL